MLYAEFLDSLFSTIREKFKRERVSCLTKLSGIPQVVTAHPYKENNSRLKFKPTVLFAALVIMTPGR